MARRILSADSVLVSQPQAALQDAGRADARQQVLLALQQRWSALPAVEPDRLLFDWENRRALEDEVAFVNRAEAVLDEAAVKLAPSVLRIVLTVRQHLSDPRDARAWLEEKLALDFRRVSELCIVAESYGLLDAGRREPGVREIERYGWSKALKLAHVRDPAERHAIWERAAETAGGASYRAVVAEIGRFRERKLIAAPDAPPRLDHIVHDAQARFAAFTRTAAHLRTRDQVQVAIEELSDLQRDLTRLRRALRERLQDDEVADLAART
ncbi:MAG: hypothetical protein HY423_09460 [Candidatus Lambdaproteobacteria bacterium]|nr:hypothetical protein [Candidatus Lambdaproteobacteria bacterium]